MTPTRIQLRLLQQAGQRLDAVWATVSPSFPLASHMLGHNALTLSLPLLGSGLAVPQISWSNFGWTLLNRTTDARIFVNGHALAPGHICHIAAGDTLEIGLCKFAIESAPENTPLTLATAASTAAPVEPQAAENLNIDMFMESLTTPSNTSDIDAFESLPVATAPVPQPEENTEIIGRLSTAYLQALQDPDAGLKIQAKDPIHVSKGLPQMPFDDDSLTLEEIISSKLDIDTIADRFSDLGASNLLERERSEDVLWLFAPEGQHPPETQRLPPRSRQDHHLMSLNSSYRIAVASQVEPAQSPAP